MVSEVARSVDWVRQQQTLFAHLENVRASQAVLFGIPVCHLYCTL